MGNKSNLEIKTEPTEKVSITIHTDIDTLVLAGPMMVKNGLGSLLLGRSEDESEKGGLQNTMYTLIQELWFTGEIKPFLRTILHIDELPKFTFRETWEIVGVFLGLLTMGSSGGTDDGLKRVSNPEEATGRRLGIRFA